jgi:phosphoglycerate dehydrogenase-like enzyme
MPAGNERLVLMTINFPDGAMEELASEFPEYLFKRSSSKEEAFTLAPHAEILVMINASKEVIANATKCKWIQTFTAGVEDYLEIDAVKENNDLTVTNVS